MVIIMSVGERITELRKLQNMSQGTLAEAVGVSRQAVSKWECGIASPDLSLIIPLTRVLKVSADELFGLNEKVSDKLEQEFEQAYGHEPVGPHRGIHPHTSTNT